MHSQGWSSCLVGKKLEDSPRTADDFARLTLELVVLPLFMDTLLGLVVKDPDSALAVFPVLQDSLLWKDAHSCQCRCTLNLDELEWYLGLCRRHDLWTHAHAEMEALRKMATPGMTGFDSTRSVMADAFDEALEGEVAEAERRCRV